MQIQVNGKPQQLDHPLNLAQLIEHLGLKPDRCAVERNRVLVSLAIALATAVAIVVIVDSAMSPPVISSAWRRTRPGASVASARSAV